MMDINERSPSGSGSGPGRARWMRRAAAALGFCLAVGSAVTAQAADYRLAPQDKLRLLVFEWRSSRAEVYAWTPLNGEFTVGASGSVSLPLIGDVKAQDLTVEQLGGTIADQLQQRLGLVVRPSVSVEVAQARPFYILGDVTTPGEFPYRPNLTVVRAVAVAGGLFRATGAGLERDITVSRGDIRVLTAERAALQARRARLDAEATGREAIAFPPDLAAAARSDGDLAAAMRQEQTIFESRARSLKAQIDGMASAKQLLANELKTLADKDANLGRQLAMAQTERDNVGALANKGLALVSRQFGTEQTVAQLETARLDVGLAIVRAQKDRIKLDADIADIQDQRRATVLQDLRTVEGRLGEIREKLQTNERLVASAETSGDMSDGSSDDVTVTQVFSIIRAGANGSAEIPATQTTPVEPGDVVQVRRRIVRKAAPTVAAPASATMPGLAPTPPRPAPAAPAGSPSSRS